VSGNRIARGRAARRSAAALRTVRKLVASGEAVIAAPWLDQHDRELLYWIPFLRWLTTEGGLDRGRLTVIGRGGADAWYSDVAGRYVDLYDHFPADDTADPAEPAASLVEELAAGGGRVLRPEILDSIHTLRRSLGARALDMTSRPAFIPDDGQPSPINRDEYVVVRFGFSDAFPDTEGNRRFRDDLVRRVAADNRVVVVRSAPEEDRLWLLEDGRSVPAPSPVPRRHGVALLTRLIRGADAFFSSYDGIAYVGPFVGTTTLAYYSDAALDALQLDDMERVSRKLAPTGRLFRARHVGHIVGEAS
jgi:hypothetical protein